MSPAKRELILAALVFFALPVLAELVLRAARVPFDAQLYGPDCALGWHQQPRISRSRANFRKAGGHISHRRAGEFLDGSATSPPRENVHGSPGTATQR